MLRTIAALFDNGRDAQEAVADLERSGFSRAGIVLAARAEGGGRRHLAAASIMTGRLAATGMRIISGVAVGALIAVLAVALGILLFRADAIPPNSASIVLLAAIGGGIVGGVIGLLSTLGLTDEEAQLYADGVRHGLTLVAVDAESERAHVVERIMRSHRAVDMERRADRLRDRPWLLRSASALATEEHRQARASALATVPRSSSRVYNFYGAMTGKRGSFEERRAGPANHAEHRNRYPMEAFRTHYNQHYIAGSYEDYLRAYRFGYAHGLLSHDWDAGESDMHRDWEQIAPGTWEQYREPVRHGWRLANEHIGENSRKGDQT